MPGLAPSIETQNGLIENGISLVGRVRRPDIRDSQRRRRGMSGLRGAEHGQGPPRKVIGQIVTLPKVALDHATRHPPPHRKFRCQKLSAPLDFQACIALKYKPEVSVVLGRKMAIHFYRGACRARAVWATAGVCPLFPWQERGCLEQRRTSTLVWLLCQGLLIDMRPRHRSRSRAFFPA